VANSSVVTEVKDNIINAMIDDETIILAIDSPDYDTPSDYIGTHIFRYNKNPKLITKSITFITVMVHTKARDRNGTYVTPTLEIWIYSHNEHIELRKGEFPGITDNRNDYISKLLDQKFNGQSGYGAIGVWKLMSNIEGVYNDDFMFRKIIYENVDVNNSFCGVN
jgi:hypothetical protein